MDITRTNICAFIDHTNVKPDTTEDAIKKLVNEAKENSFKSVCVTPYRVKDARKFLDKKDEWIPGHSPRLRQVEAGARDDGTERPELICVIGFPHGFTTTQEKVNEAKTAVKDGATEIDMVVNIGAIKDGAWNYVKDEITQIAESINPISLKVILEIGFLTREELIRGCEVTKEAGGAFVKTSTGFGPRTPTVEDIKIMRQTVGENFGVKASGGIHTFEQAKAMIEAGANRIGTSSALQIIGKDKIRKENSASNE